MGITWMILCAVCMAGGNLCMRKSIDCGGTSKTYLMLQLTLSALFLISFGPLRMHDHHISSFIVLWGLLGGLAMAGIMSFLGKALETGPSGLSIAILNASCVIPILVFVSLFGASFGFTYTRYNAIGAICVTLGILWAGFRGMKQHARGKQPSLWIVWISLCFACHVLYLVLLQWRSLWITFPGNQSLLLGLYAKQADSAWFLPIVFLTAACVQTLLFYKTERRKPLPFEILFSIIGSLAQALGTLAMTKATLVASAGEQPLLFPVFSVGTIFFCHLWGKLLYKEKIDWLANSLCILGIVIGGLSALNS